MLRRLALAAAIALAPFAAQAQYATIGPTPPVAENSYRLANTAWVNSLIASGLTLASGKIWIGSAGNIATPQTPSGDCTVNLSGVITCTQSAGNFQVIGNLTVGGSIIDGNGILATNIAAPATPAAGTTRFYADSTTKTLSSKNDAGTVSNTVVASLAVANQFMTGISAAGVITRAQPAFSDLSGQGTCAQEPALTGGVTSSAGSCATTVVTNANLTGPVTSVGNATAIANNQITRAMEAQGVARSVVGVTGNATANVADIQGTASQFLGVNSGGTALAFQTMSGACTLSGAAVTCTNNTSIMGGGATNTILAGATGWVGVGLICNATESFCFLPQPQAGTISNLYVNVGAAPGVGQTYTVTVRKNSTNQTVTCTISGGSATSCNDTTHSFAVAAADNVSVQIAASGAATTVSVANFGFKLATTSP